MKHRLKQTGSPFDWTAIGITLLVALFFAAAISSVLIGGIPYLADALRFPEIQHAIRLSLLTSLASTSACMLLAMPCAYALARLRIPGQRFLQVLIELPLSLPYLVLGLCLLIVFSSPVGKALRTAGFPVVFHQNGIVLAQLFVNLPFAIRLLRTELESFDPRLEFVAGTLGASRWMRFRTILLPQCRIALMTCAILTWSRAMGEFGATLMLVGVTRMKTETLPGSIYLSISTGENGMAMAAAIIMLIISSMALAASSLISARFKTDRR